MCHCILWNCLSFGIESKILWYDWVTHYQWHCVVQIGSGKRDSYHHCCIMYTYIDDLNHHLQSTAVGCYVWGAWVNSLSYADDMVLLAPTVYNSSSDTLVDMSRICWTSWHCRQHNEKSMCAGPTKAITVSNSSLSEEDSCGSGPSSCCGISAAFSFG